MHLTLDKWLSTYVISINIHNGAGVSSHNMIMNVLKQYEANGIQ